MDERARRHPRADDERRPDPQPERQAISEAVKEQAWQDRALLQLDHTPRGEERRQSIEHHEERLGKELAERKSGLAVEDVENAWADFRKKAGAIEAIKDPIRRGYAEDVNLAFAGILERAAAGQGRAADRPQEEPAAPPELPHTAAPPPRRLPRAPTRLDDQLPPLRPAPLPPAERAGVRAEAIEHIKRPQLATERPTAAPRSADHYLREASELRARDAPLAALVERDADKLRAQPAVRDASLDQLKADLKLVAERREQVRDSNPDSAGKLNVRALALATICEERSDGAGAGGSQVTARPGALAPRRPDDESTERGGGNTLELTARDVIDERPENPRENSEQRPEPSEASFNARLSPRYRERAAQIERHVANVAADADRELFSLEREAKDDPRAAAELAAVERAVLQLRSSFRSHDPHDLAAEVNELRERELREPELTDGRLRAQRLAFGVLASEAYVRQSELVNVVKRERIEEVQHLEPAAREAFMREAALLLRQPAFNDRPAVNRELLRADDEHLARQFAVARAAPSVLELHRDAKWRDETFHDRVTERVQAHLLQPEGDDALEGRLAEARVRAALPDDAITSRLARDEAVELAEVLRRLPISRSLEVNTPAIRHRPLTPAGPA
ncbi:MAG: hypothetical protein Q8O67_23140 [Deltaproteobacteria bacterium]|nr:hypothetical protein [Deltaproteobacteria bacterium]